MDQDADGSNSCILERLYAWEKKLYDEVKASESIRKEYDRKCEQLRHQSAKDESTRVIDKTRSIVRDLHSRIIVTIYSFDTISKQIERVRDKELLLQLLELNQGSTRTIEANARREILTQLLEEFKCLALASIIGLTAIPHTSNLSMDGCKTAYYILLIVPRIEGGRSSLAVFLPLRYLFFSVINLQGSRHYWPRI
ncbi:hypothetical protein Ahy_A10g050240 [Arachis hypogaea]|uniref:DUF632 domain-containing protein n=1 Tax=Arachis hypogaea TaxID=3818 RepID=A0A445B8W5_ARAHY|nr:hypothetical protein Ahy_A10g050240 [Arachis hypogaea]